MSDMFAATPHSRPTRRRTLLSETVRRPWRIRTAACLLAGCGLALPTTRLAAQQQWAPVPSAAVVAEAPPRPHSGHPLPEQISCDAERFRKPRRRSASQPALGRTHQCRADGRGRSVHRRRRAIQPERAVDHRPGSGQHHAHALVRQQPSAVDLPGQHGSRPQRRRASPARLQQARTEAGDPLPEQQGLPDSLLRQARGEGAGPRHGGGGQHPADHPRRSRRDAAGVGRIRREANAQPAAAGQPATRDNQGGRIGRPGRDRYREPAGGPRRVPGDAPRADCRARPLAAPQHGRQPDQRALRSPAHRAANPQYTPAVARGDL